MVGSVEVGAVIIGRNEGARLVKCLASVVPQVGKTIYVDSGSTDGSQASAQEAGAEVVALDTTIPFTAARARNAGFAALMAGQYPPDYVQFIDGDCILQPHWITTARKFLDEHAQVAVACGRRRELFPNASVYNHLIDREWDTPVGQAKACGGDALMRTDALQQVQGYNADLIAGEEPELCIRLGQVDWHIWRLDEEMTQHDANLTRFSQWWKRNRRAGHAYAEGAAMHGSPPELHGVLDTRSALFWGGGVVFVLVLGLAISPWFFLGLLAWPLQLVRLGLRSQDWRFAFFLLLGKMPEAQGVLGFWLGKFRGRRAKLIEYK